jgi:hypothetical protein
MVVLAAVMSVTAEPASAQSIDLQRDIDNLSAFDYPTRTGAARMLRRAPAAEVVPALAAAARAHADQFVRYRALVLLTSFNAPDTPALMRGLLTDRNDRVREVVYRWLERNPDPVLQPTLLAALETEQAEFVRPALVRAIVALPPGVPVQRALVVEVGRGFDFFRSAVIEALGERRAEYAVDAIAAVAVLDGPLQDDAVLALGRIGGPAAGKAVRMLGEQFSPLPEPPPAVLMLQAVMCLLGDSDCATRRAILADVATDPMTAAADVRLAVDALVVLTERGDERARDALFSRVARVQRAHARLGLAKWALRRPDDIVAWLAAAGTEERTLAIDLLREGFETLEEDFAEEQFFAAARAAYWRAAEGSGARDVAATLIDRLEF